MFLSICRVLCDVTYPEPLEKQGRVIYFVMKFPSWLAVEQMQSQREGMESCLYDEVLSVGGDGLILSVTLVFRGAGT